MRPVCLGMLVAFLICAFAARDGYSYESRYVVEAIQRVTFADGKSQTARNNARCICIDPHGVAHMVWEDSRSGNFEIYYASQIGDSVSHPRRLSYSKSESFAPCVACDSENVHILWKDYTEDNFELYYVRLHDGEEAARRRITRNAAESEAPVAVLGPDGALNIAWHEGPYARTQVLYGKIVNDSMITKTPICTEHPGAFRPDIACDKDGRLLIAWFEGQDLKAKTWDGASWGEETLVARNDSRPYRLSLANTGTDTWALSWFDRTTEASYDILAKFSDGTKWYGLTRLSSSNIAFYPGMTNINGGQVAVVWEELDAKTREYLLVLRCYNGKDWGERLEIVRHTAMSRYCSLASDGDVLHAIWFNPKTGNNEIYHGRLRRE